MKLLVLTEDFYKDTNGGAHARTRFAELATTEGHEIIVFTTNDGELPSHETINGIEIHRTIPTLLGREGYNWLAILLRIIFSVHLTWKLMFWMRGKSIDGIHPTTNAVHWSAWVIGQIYSIPVINFISYTPSLDPNKHLLSPMSLLEKINFKLFMGDVVFCRTRDVATKVENNSRSTAKTIDGILNKSRFAELNQKQFLNKRDDEFSISKSETLVSFVGRLVPIKRPCEAVHVLNQLPDTYYLNVVGGGPGQDELTKLVQGNDLNDRIRLLGQVPHAEVLEILGASDILILTSRAEAYPTVVFEALALGNHVYAPPVGGLPIITHERLHLCQPQDMASQMSASGPSGTYAVDEAVLDQYSLESYTEDILAAFQKLNE